MNLIQRFFHKSEQPLRYDKIRITWLPCNNAWPEPNAYIGMEGIVEEVYHDGGFLLYTGSSYLSVPKKPYRWIRI